MSDITVSTQRATLRTVVAGVLVLLLVGVLVAGAGTAETDNQLDTGVLENGVTADGDSFNTTAYVGSEDGVVHAVDVGGAEVKYLGVKWFERLRLSSSRKTASSVRPRGFTVLSVPSRNGRMDAGEFNSPRPPSIEVGWN